MRLTRTMEQSIHIGHKILLHPEKWFPMREIFMRILCGFAYTDFQGNFNQGQFGSFGIVGTPVIDKSTNTIYLVSRYRDPNVDNTPH